MFAVDNIAYKTQEAVDKCGVEMIVAHMDAQYTAMLNEDYVGFMNQTIKTTLAHVRKNGQKCPPPNVRKQRKHSIPPGETASNSKRLPSSSTVIRPSIKKLASLSPTIQKPNFSLNKCSSKTCSGRSKFRTMK